MDDHDAKILLVSQIPANTFFRHPNAGGLATDEKLFWRRVAWSPDGTHLLAQSDDHHLDLFRLEGKGPKAFLQFCFAIRAPSTLLDFAWYPYARKDDEATWCFVMSARDTIVRLVDAYAGQTRATYGLQDHTERFIGAQALCFSLDGVRLLCGHDNTLTIFDLSRPGTNTFVDQVQLSPSKRAVRKGKASSGQRGTISAICVGCDRLRGSGKELVAVGTFSGNIAVYDLNKPGKSSEQACVAGWKEEKSQGISQLIFHPTSPHILFLRSRRAHGIRAYDLRYVGDRRSFLHSAPHLALLGRFACGQEEDENSALSQQRLFFDIDVNGTRLYAGDVTGRLGIWSIDDKLSGVEFHKEQAVFGNVSRSDSDLLWAEIDQVRAANDAIPSVAIHPHLPLCAIASGSRTWNVSEKVHHGVKDGALTLYTIPR